MKKNGNRNIHVNAKRGQILPKLFAVFS